MENKVVAVEELPALEEADMHHVVKSALNTYLRQLDTHYPITLRNGKIVSGQGRLWAARQVGRTTVAVQELD